MRCAWRADARPWCSDRWTADLPDSHPQNPTFRHGGSGRTNRRHTVLHSTQANHASSPWHRFRRARIRGIQTLEAPMRAPTLALVVSLSLILAGSAAQLDEGSIAGTVKDSTGAALPGVTVRAV